MYHNNNIIRGYNFFYNYVEPVDKRAKGSFLKKILKKLVNYKNEN